MPVKRISPYLPGPGNPIYSLTLMVSYPNRSSFILPLCSFSPLNLSQPQTAGKLYRSNNVCKRANEPLRRIPTLLDSCLLQGVSTQCRKHLRLTPSVVDLRQHQHGAKVPEAHATD
eukprot:3324659-Pyramimonas_sp.AAC.1